MAVEIIFQPDNIGVKFLGLGGSCEEWLAAPTFLFLSHQNIEMVFGSFVDRPG